MNDNILMVGQPAPNFAVKVGFSGRVRCMLNKGTDRESDTGWFHNLILDGGLDRLGDVANSNSMFPWCSIGTGTTAPVNGNSALQAFVADTSNIVGASNAVPGTSPYVSTCTVEWTYAQGAVVGNMAELGFGWASGGGSLWSRALILDGGGSPTTLTVTSIDQLTVFYELTCAPQITDQTGTVSISSTSYDYTGRLANAATFFNNMTGAFLSGSGFPFGVGVGSGGFGMATFSTQTLGAVTSTPAGTATSAASGSATTGSYTAGQKHLDNTFTVTPLEGNSSGGIGSMVLSFGGSQMDFQYSLAKTSGGQALPKDNTKTFTLNVRFAWDRV